MPPKQCTMASDWCRNVNVCVCVCEAVRAGAAGDDHCRPASTLRWWSRRLDTTTASTSHLSCERQPLSTAPITSLVFSAPDVVATSTCCAATTPDTRQSLPRMLTEHPMSAPGRSPDVDRCPSCRSNLNRPIAAAEAPPSRQGSLRSRQFQDGALTQTVAARAAVPGHRRCLTHARTRLPPRAAAVDATQRERVSCGEASMTRTCHCRDVITPVTITTSSHLSLSWRHHTHLSLSWRHHSCHYHDVMTRICHCRDVMTPVTLVTSSRLSLSWRCSIA